MSSIEPIVLLEQKVTPQIVNTQQLDTDVDQKSSLLSQFYPILLSIFHHYPDRIGTAIHAKEHALQDVLNHQSAIVDQLVKGLVKHHSLPEVTVMSLVNNAILLSAQALQDYAGQGKVATYLHEHLITTANQFPAWAAVLIAPLGLSSVLSKDMVSQHVHTTSEKGGMWRGIAGLIALIILTFLVMFFWKSCQHQQEAVAPTVSAPVQSKEVKSLAPATFTLVSGQGNHVGACHASVGNASLATQLQATLVKVFDTQVTCTMHVDQAYASDFPAETMMESILMAVREVPNATIEWVGNKIVLNAPDASALTILVEKVKAIAPQLTVLPAEPLNEEQSVGKSIDETKQALSGLNESARPEDIARALNIQVINFPSGSKTIPQVNKDVLDQAAILIQQVPNVKLDVEGYTDSTGNAELNKKLSERRAQSVVDYLVSKGVSADKLHAVGFGQDNPIADNVTQQGKFRNRRIEFKVTDTQSGTTSVVDEQHAQTSTAIEQGVGN